MWVVRIGFNVMNFPLIDWHVDRRRRWTDICDRTDVVTTDEYPPYTRIDDLFGIEANAIDYSPVANDTAVKRIFGPTYYLLYGKSRTQSRWSREMTHHSRVQRMRQPNRWQSTRRIEECNANRKLRCLHQQRGR